MEKILCAYQGSESYAFISYSHKDKGGSIPRYPCDAGKRVQCLV